VLTWSSRGDERTLHDRVLAGSPPPTRTITGSWRERLSTRRTYARAARYTMGDLTMLRQELAAGFLIAGFISVHVPSSWWANVFFTGHDAWTVLWANGVAFGGVISFIFADLITLPLLLIYRRFYGTGAALRLFGWLWAVMSLGGLLVDRLFTLARLVPPSHHVAITSGHFALGWTLVLNVIATVVLVALWVLTRTPAHDLSAIDPICGMNVDTSAPAATRERRPRRLFLLASLRRAIRSPRGTLADARRASR